MRSAIESRLHKTWYGTRRPGLLLLALEQVYRLLSTVRRGLGRLAAARDLEGMPVVVVGNLAAGGSGKTPLVIRLCELARDCGLRPGVVSRGYGRRRREPLRVSKDHSAADVGDEPLLIARRCAVPVQVDADRERAVRALLRDGVDVVFADDGLQRASLPRALELCVVDERRGLGNGHQLPAGPLREPAARLHSVDYVVHHGGPVPHRAAGSAGARGPFAVEMHLRPGDLHRVGGEGRMSLEALRQEPGEIHAVAGIADPGRFFDMLAGLGVAVTQHGFADHHRFCAMDFSAIPEGAMIVMTEKDAVKCDGLGLPNAWFLRVDAVLGDRFEAAIKVRLLDLAGAARGKAGRG